MGNNLRDGEEMVANLHLAWVTFGEKLSGRHMSVAELNHEAVSPCLGAYNQM